MSEVLPKSDSRAWIYYWKCDRPAAFHGTTSEADHDSLLVSIRATLETYFQGRPFELQPGPGQGNHATAIVTVDGQKLFVRVEDGPEADDYMEVESHIMGEVRALGLPVPLIHHVDATREQVPYAWQLMDLVADPDLNRHFKEGTMDVPAIAYQTGAAVAQWQALRFERFGPFQVSALRQEKILRGHHARYRDYYFLNLSNHLRFLLEHHFLTNTEVLDITGIIEKHLDLLNLAEGCLVHKDLALWNILGDTHSISAFIDWDDSISGDAMDDLSLLACFHHGDFMSQAFAGYTSVRPLPEQHQRRFWLHLLRNMIVKSVIRVGAGYFKRSDGFFLIGSGSGGADLETFTRHRLNEALTGLRDDLPSTQLTSL